LNELENIKDRELMIKNQLTVIERYKFQAKVALIKMKAQLLIRGLIVMIDQ